MRADVTVCHHDLLPFKFDVTRVRISETNSQSGLSSSFHAQTRSRNLSCRLEQAVRLQQSAKGSQTSTMAF